MDNMDTARLPRRPNRLWVAAILNMIIGTLAVGLLIFLLTSARVPDEVRPRVTAVAFGGILACLLVAYSVLALVGKSFARRTLLLIATIYRKT